MNRIKNTSGIMAAIMTAVLSITLTGCTGAVSTAAPAAETAAAQEPASAPEAQEQKEDMSAKITEPYFTKGVYVNYAKEAENPTLDYYYVFDSETTGHTDDGSVGMGLPFACEQKDSTVSFTFGGEGEEPVVLTVDSVEEGTVTGHFDDGVELVFIPVEDVDPADFDAENYMREAAGESIIYKDANGWTVRYDPKLFTVNGGGPSVSFVYTGESAGTNMITASYNVDGRDARTAIEDLAKEWGDKATVTDGIFPGTEDAKGYWATLPPENDSSGLYSTAMARDYMDGYLMFELTGHNSGNDEEDMAVSDALAGIIDSLEFQSI
ncbi:MAG: hypothetical protein K6E49_05155 [Lachnospiraceae bacterium]|nr:hypothetical protein [Lachnospiraceae bacterium]